MADVVISHSMESRKGAKERETYPKVNQERSHAMEAFVAQTFREEVQTGN